MRIQLKRYALINAEGVIWGGMVSNSKSGLYEAYGSRFASEQDGWRVKPVTIYYNMKQEKTKPEKKSGRGRPKKVAVQAVAPKEPEFPIHPLTGSQQWP